jgi:uridine kinase
MNNSPKKNCYTVQSLIPFLPRAQVYLIAGPTGAGKTRLAHGLSKHIKARVIGMDNYFIDEEKVPIEYSDIYGNAPQWDSPKACDFELLISNLIQLIQTGKATIPLFSFPLNKRIGSNIIEIARSMPIIVEGLHAIRCQSPLEKERIITYSIYIDADTKIRIERIRVRDKEERDRPEHLFDKRFYFIQQAEKKWITEQSSSANLILSSKEDYEYEIQSRS